jgi:hypothetical protein
MTGLSPPHIAAIAPTFFLAGLVKGVTGMGLPTVAMGQELSSDREPFEVIRKPCTRVTGVQNTLVCWAVAQYQMPRWLPRLRFWR